MKRIIARICVVSLSLIMAFTMTDMQFAWAEGPVEAPGGVVTLGDTSAAEAAFSDAADVINDGSRMIISLRDDIDLAAPVTFKRSDGFDKVILELNTRTMKAAAGTDGDEEDAARGCDAIQIIADEFDVEIKGPGSVIGGKGAIYEGSSFKSGQDGGAAVQFLDSEYYPEEDNSKLKYGLSVTEDAALKGGEGADVTSEEWQYNIANYTGSLYSAPRLTSGDGGPAIGQFNCGVLNAEGTVAYSRIDVENGIVEGGEGGTIDMSDFTPTQYALMNSPAAETAMSGQQISNYESRVLGLSKLAAGRGGDGIRIGTGRKYIYVGESAEVKGSSCGTVDFGNNEEINKLNTGISYGSASMTTQHNAGDAGDGIAVWVADIGLTKAEAGYTGDGWQEKTRDSDDMGIYIDGTVTGGSAPDVKAMGVKGAEGGAGIALYGDKDRFGWPDDNEGHKQWGIIDIEGSVTGGNGGTSVDRSGGSGGEGIFEDFNIDSNDDGTNYYIVNGTVKGGNGGSSYSAGFGSGGNGMNFSYMYRSDLNVAGTGTAVSGDAGNTVDHSGIDTDDSVQKAIRLNPLMDEEQSGTYYNNTVTVNKETGAGAQAIATEEIDVTAEMTSFNDYPTTATEISCNIEKPAGYTGNVYVDWFANIQLQDNTPEVCDIEPPGTNNTSFHLLDNNAYKYLAYEGSDYASLGWHKYNLDITTTDRIKEILKYGKGSNAKIFCKVLLEDGSWGESNVMEFTNEGWNGSSPGGNEDQEIADQTAETITGLLMDLPDISALDPEVPADAEVIAEVKEAIEDAVEVFNGLTDAQKTLFDHNVRAMLDDAVAEFNEAFPDQAIVGPEGPDTSVIRSDMITVPDAVYNGKLRKPAVTVTAGGKVLEEYKDYVVIAYSNNKNVGTAKVSVEGVGDYTGIADAEFKIIPKAATIRTPKRGKTYITVKWKAQKTKMSKKRITGYEVEIAKDADFTEEPRTLVRTGYKRTYKKVTKLERKTRYYMHVRTYTNINGVKYYSNWSKTKTAATK